MPEDPKDRQNGSFARQKASFLDQETRLSEKVEFSTELRGVLINLLSNVQSDWIE